MKLKTFLITLTFILGSNLTIAQEIKPDFKKNEQQQDLQRTIDRYQPNREQRRHNQFKGKRR